MVVVFQFLFTKHLTELTVPAMEGMEGCEDSSDEGQIGSEPGDISELFKWPQRYARTMLTSPEARSNFESLLQYDIEHHENFSGTGSAGIALHMAHSAFTRRLVASEYNKGSIKAMINQQVVC